MKTFLILLLAFCPISSTLAASQMSSQMRWRGAVSLWHRPAACDGRAPECVFPKPIGPNIPVDLEIKEPANYGRYLVARMETERNEWKILLTVAWVKPEDRSQPYLITQTRLTHNKVGTVAECSRFDGTDAFTFLPPGSCTARVGSEIMGVSLLSPLAKLR